MTPDPRIYSGDGIVNLRQFLCDYVFASEMLEFLETLPEGDRMHIHSCSCVSAGVFLAVFKTTEYMLPANPERTLRIRATAPADLSGNWSFVLIA